MLWALGNVGEERYYLQTSVQCIISLNEGCKISQQRATFSQKWWFYCSIGLRKPEWPFFFLSDVMAINPPMYFGSEKLSMKRVSTLTNNVSPPVRENVTFPSRLSLHMVIFTNVSLQISPSDRITSCTWDINQFAIVRFLLFPIYAGWKLRHSATWAELHMFAWTLKGTHFMKTVMGSLDCSFVWSSSWLFACFKIRENTFFCPILVHHCVSFAILSKKGYLLKACASRLRGWTKYFLLLPSSSFPLVITPHQKAFQSAALSHSSLNWFLRVTFQLIFQSVLS